MALYIAFIASFNLCIGYALGVYIGVMPGITPRRRQMEGTEETPIALDIPAAPKPEQRPAKKAEAASTSRPAEPAEPEPEPLLETKPPEEAETIEEPTSNSEVAEDDSEETKADYSNILKGLEVFKSKLDSVSEKLNATEDNRAEVDECANELKEANSEYLVKASEAMQDLAEEDSATATAEHLQLQESLSKQSAEVEEANQVIEGLLEEVDTSVVRQKLMDSTEQLSETAEQVEQAVPTVKEQPKETETGQLVSGEELSAVESTQDDNPLQQLDQLMQDVDRIIKEEGPATLLQVGAIELEPAAGNGPDHIERLLDSLETEIAKELAEGQKLAVEGRNRFVLHLPGDDQATANERCERVRQRIAATTFHSEGEEIRATASCAVAEVAGADSHKVVMGRLTEALEGAKDMGGSCTVHHNGAAVEAVPAKELDIEESNVYL